MSVLKDEKSWQEQYSEDYRKNLRDHAEHVWQERYNKDSSIYGKRGSKKYLTAQCEFFIGAMTAINFMSPNPDPNLLSSEVPPYWVICIMSGRDILGAEKKKEFDPNDLVKAERSEHGTA